MARLELERLSKHFGPTVAVRDVSLDVRDGEFLVLLGPSGCGKTTTLRMIAGFLPPASGRVRLGGKDVTTLPPWKRDAGMVFQSYALFPHLTVGENIAFGLQMRKVPKPDIPARVHVYTTMAAALVAGGKPGDFEKATGALLELKKLKPRIYPSNEALAQALMTEEIGLCIMWKARAVQWQNAGANILTVAPKEGLITYVSGFTIPKNAPNRDGAYAFLDASLEASAQEAFAVDMGYNPVVGNAKVAPDLRKRIGFTPEEEKLFVSPDLEFMAKRAAELKDFWDKQFKG